MGRELLPEEEIDEVVDHFPSECRGCQREFTEGERVPRWGAGRHQVAELPETWVTYTEHRTHRLRCPACKKRTRAALGVIGESAFGPRLQATVVTLTVRNRVSRRDLGELAGELFQVGISIGAAQAICERASGLLAGPYEHLTAGVLGSAAVNVDETGWFRQGSERTMWTAATPEAAIFKIVADRHRDRLEELLGAAFEGIVCSDRWWAYDVIDPERRQACWSHLVRDFRRHSEGLAKQQVFGQQGLALTKRLFEVWHAHTVHQDRDRLAKEMQPVKDELRALLEEAGEKSTRNRKHRRFANNLLKIWPALWTFVTTPGVEPTNNAAERALRGPVIARRLSHGNQSDDGERFTERALSASVTCRLQGRSLYHYLSELFTAHQHGGALPVLI
ncbi:MAG: IS66 family transposase [Actinomycetota bacterium]|nr:IS66 family transposase [Actinomycetota bacterium]